MNNNKNTKGSMVHYSRMIPYVEKDEIKKNSGNGTCGSMSAGNGKHSKRRNSDGNFSKNTGNCKVCICYTCNWCISVVRIYGSALCTTGNALGNIAQWRANMSGDMALAYTIGASSFGHDGSTTDIMSKEYFVRASALRSFSKDASMFTYYSSASTKIYY